MISKCFFFLKTLKMRYEWEPESRTLREPAGGRKRNVQIPEIVKRNKENREDWCVISLIVSTETGNGAVTHRKWADGGDKAGKWLRKSKQVRSDAERIREVLQCFCLMFPLRSWCSLSIFEVTCHRDGFNTPPGSIERTAASRCRAVNPINLHVQWRVQTCCYHVRSVSVEHMWWKQPVGINRTAEEVFNYFTSVTVLISHKILCYK